MAKGYTAFVLPEAERARLLGIFPTDFCNVVAHHVTDEFGVDGLRDATVGIKTIRIIGEARSISMGVQALVVEVVDDRFDVAYPQTSRVRRDGKLYHITWSLGNTNSVHGGKPKPIHSNDLLNKPYAPIGYFDEDKVVCVEVEYTFIPF